MIQGGLRAPLFLENIDFGVINLGKFRGNKNHVEFLKKW